MRIYAASSPHVKATHALPQPYCLLARAAAGRTEPAAGRAEPAAGRAEPAAGRAEPAAHLCIAHPSQCYTMKLAELGNQ
jgi:hypothetical protein